MDINIVGQLSFKFEYYIEDIFKVETVSKIRFVSSLN